LSSLVTHRNGSEFTLARDLSFACRKKAIISQWEVGVEIVGNEKTYRLNRYPRQSPTGTSSLAAQIGTTTGQTHLDILCGKQLLLHRFQKICSLVADGVFDRFAEA
jgi:hypothetical protein